MSWENMDLATKLDDLNERLKKLESPVKKGKK